MTDKKVYEVIDLLIDDAKRGMQAMELLNQWEAKAKKTVLDPQNESAKVVLGKIQEFKATWGE